MKLTQFRHTVEKGVIVICTKRATGQPEGWDGDMDEMVNVPLQVVRKRDRSVELIHPENYNVYSFNYAAIELFGIKRVEVKIDNINFISDSTVHIETLVGLSLRKDFDILISQVTTEKDRINLSSPVLQKIQTHCPRMIGVMLSNKIIERVTNVKRRV